MRPQFAFLAMQAPIVQSAASASTSLPASVTIAPLASQLMAQGQTQLLLAPFGESCLTVATATVALLGSRFLLTLPASGTASANKVLSMSTEVSKTLIGFRG